MSFSSQNLQIMQSMGNRVRWLVIAFVKVSIQKIVAGLAVNPVTMDSAIVPANILVVAKAPYLVGVSHPPAMTVVGMKIAWLIVSLIALEPRMTMRLHLENTIVKFIKNVTIQTNLHFLHKANNGLMQPESVFNRLLLIY